MCSVFLPKLLDIHVHARHHGFLPDDWQALSALNRWCSNADRKALARSIRAQLLRWNWPSSGVFRIGLFPTAAAKRNTDRKLVLGAPALASNAWPA
jgi:hypothetical protein